MVHSDVIVNNKEKAMLRKSVRRPLWKLFSHRTVFAVHEEAPISAFLHDTADRRQQQVVLDFTTYDLPKA